MNKPFPHWLRGAVVVFLLGFLIYFTVRENSSIRTVEWIPWGVRRYLERYIYLRNFWGFLPVGLFIGWAYRVRPVLWKDGRVHWMVVGLLLFPVVKELVQIPLPHRHCNPVGMLSGLIGMALGLTLGHFLIIRSLKRRP